MNLRRHSRPQKDDIDYLLQDEKATRLTPKMIEYLEYLIPLVRGKVFNRIGFDGSETRQQAMKVFVEKKISLKVAQLEIRRRRKMKNV
jgi:hypothetical protein